MRDMTFILKKKFFHILLNQSCQLIKHGNFNWKKVFHNIDENKIELNILNTLCGSKKFDDELRHILSEYPEVIKVFPTLLAVREQEINIF